MKYTVIIPAYNVENYINGAVNAVLSQTYKNIEIIIINDGSTDNTFRVISNYKNNKQVKIINQKNQGVSSARNSGIKEATGDYIFFLDSDDLIEPNLFEEINFFLNESEINIDMISFGYKIIKNGVVKEEMSSYEFNKKIIESRHFLNYYLTKKVQQHICSFVVKRELVLSKKIFFNENTFYGEDKEFQIKCMFHSYRVGYLSSPFFMYMMRDESAVNMKFSERNLTSLDASIRVLKYVETVGIDVLTKYNLQRYSDLQFFYILRKSSGSNLSKVVKNYSGFLKYDYPVLYNKKFALFYVCKVLYKIHPELLIFLFKNLK